jgi:hypothetical protein
MGCTFEGREEPRRIAEVRVPPKRAPAYGPNFSAVQQDQKGAVKEGLIGSGQLRFPI